MGLVELVGAALGGLVVWKVIQFEDEIRELRARIEELEDEMEEVGREVEQ